MIFTSRAKLEDMKLRAQYLDLVEFSLMRGDTESAKFFGDFSKKLKERIETHDYTEEDKMYDNLVKLDKAWADLSTEDMKTPPEA